MTPLTECRESVGDLPLDCDSAAAEKDIKGTEAEMVEAGAVVEEVVAAGETRRGVWLT